MRITGEAQRARGALALLMLACSACSPARAIPGTQVSSRFGQRQTLYDAPFPSEELRRPSGQIDLSLFPNPTNIGLINQTLALLDASSIGFGTSSGIFFRLDGALDPARLPSPDGSIGADSPALLMGIDADSRDYLRSLPLQVGFALDGGPFGDKNLLTLLPAQGFPLRANTAYVAVVRRSLLDAAGARLGVALEVEQLLRGEQPAGMSGAVFALYRRAVQAIELKGVPLDDVAALTAFTTGDPTAQLSQVRDDALAHQPPPLPQTPLALRQRYPDFCLYQSTVQMPDYQSGTPPFSGSGGAWLFDANGKPIFQRSEKANLFVTIPRRAPPANGWPAVLYLRAGGTGDVPMVDRGPASAIGGPNAPGEGPAMQFAQVGWAGVEVDGPLGGLRNTTGGDEEYLIFNFLNPSALRDNVRESAMEASLMAAALAQLHVDATSCDPQTPGAQRFDLAHLALFGHSTGATIAPLAGAITAQIGAHLMSGAGGSYLNNVLYKKRPIDVLPLAEALLGYSASGQRLVFSDPVLSLIQWAGEPADPQVYARQLIREPLPGHPPKQVLMFQGIVDHYIMPPMANALSLALGLDLGGTELDVTATELESLPSIGPLLPLAGHTKIALPASSNVPVAIGSVPVSGSASGTQAMGSAVTAVLLQELQDEIDDGHEVVFQTEPPKHAYRCFLQSWAESGVARVPRPGPVAASCE